ncbi:Peroxidase 73 [Capsicum annuum]|uniref:peroxidase 16 n=1 Tax=Capsicum annuum TaxID=4072 RepID=UPI001FB04E2B|nr:peroxidase 16 [Capsicum annuum]KAF3616687.1 Peroxidase 73 [Capsicum annuum]KAF3617904.1 Peroxidase 73 [Capsicum annuum]
MERWGGLYVLILAIIVILGGADGQLQENFYAFTCPNVEFTVQQAVATKFSQTFVTIPATLRLFFHDCFVEGCDASVMIASPDGDAEKDFKDNLSLAGDGFDTVVKAKEAVEALCPGVVSCADILAIAARDVVVLAGGPSYNVELGRRDGLISKASRVAGNLPEPNFNLIQLNTMFARHNLSQFDMIALSGAHTLGFSHCDRFANRIYSFTPSNPDPSLDPEYAKQLMGMCPQNVDPSIAINMDPVTPRTFDNEYYKNLVGGKGLFTSDQVLFTDESSQGTVNDFANNGFDFNGAFVTAMRKLGRVGVKTGDKGEIRLDCSRFNS